MQIKSAETISVIMPAYNAAATLGQAVESVLSQSYRYWELIIVDDCSADETFAIASQYAEKDSRIRVLKNEKNSGASRTRHRAVEAATGLWIAFLDSDDLWQSDKLEKQVIRQQETKAQLVFTGSAFIREDASRVDWVMHVPETVGYRQILKQNVISNSSVLVRKELFLQHEVIASDLHEDYACWLKMLRCGIVAHGIDEPLLIYRLSAGSKSGNKLKSAKMNWNAYRAAGIHVFSRIYYMLWYTVKGLLKYSHFTGKKESNR